MPWVIGVMDIEVLSYIFLRELSGHCSKGVVSTKQQHMPTLGEIPHSRMTKTGRITSVTYVKPMHQVAKTVIASSVQGAHDCVIYSQSVQAVL